MTSLNDSSAIFRYHRDMIALHGNKGSAALGWKDQHSQDVRFSALGTIANLTGKSVMDAGCGHGDFYTYLNHLYPGIDYTGVEQIPELFNTALKRHAKAPAKFIQGNFITLQLPQYDYVFASGSLNYRSADPDFIYKAISKLYEHCTRGVGFNLLSNVNPNGLITAYNPEKIMAYCTSICASVVFKNDYDPDDFTIFMYR